jgi:methylation protein EvaC
MKKEFLDLGIQPLANGFLRQEDIPNEYLYDLKVGVDDQTGLVSLMNFVPPELMFNDTYPYSSSGSATMRKHFKDIATKIKLFRPNPKILEIGSNDGVFLQHFSKSKAMGVEPCSNFAAITTDAGYTTYNSLWNRETLDEIYWNHGLFDVVYAANCFCHIEDIAEALSCAEEALKPDGLLILEDPSLEKVIKRVSYDQFYDEHAHMFSFVALQGLLRREAGMRAISVDSLDVHGGSNRIWACKLGSDITEDETVAATLKREYQAEIADYDRLCKFADEVAQNKVMLRKTIDYHKKQGRKLCSYGATSKSTTVFNYCDIGILDLDYILDTTPAKQGLMSPGMHIPVIPYGGGIPDEISVAFLGAWNFKEEIYRKEMDWMMSGGMFISHVDPVNV